MPLPKPNWTEADVHAVRAMISGMASAEQQRRGMNFIGREICHTLDSPYVANGSDRDTFVMLGRHQVGVIISSAQTAEVLEAARASDAKLTQPSPERRGTRHEKPR